MQRKKRALTALGAVIGAGLLLTGLNLGGAAGCGGGTTPGGGGGGGGGTGGDLSTVTAVTITGVTTDPSFATNGLIRVGFTTTDSSGNPVLSDTALTLAALSAGSGGWSKGVFKSDAADNDAVSCSISTPSEETCTLDGDVSSTAPSGGAGNVGAADLIDDSGSMATSDPDGDRGDAAKLFIDTICGDSTNVFGTFDFGVMGNLGFSETRDLLTANGSTVTDTLPYIGCSADNVTAAKAAIDAQIQDNGGTPLYESVLELCTDMVAKSAAGESLDGRALAIMVLSDGQPNSDSSKAAAEACVADNDITTCTVGLGPGSELSVSANPSAVSALKELSTAGSCVYAAATDVSALGPIFTAIGAAVSTGQNFADFAVTPIPASGTTVNGTLTVGTGTATFSFVAP